jgi:hypothetical protein
MLRRVVGVFIVKDMRTAREQEEANTVRIKPVQANLPLEIQRSHGQRSAARIERDYLWSRPSCSAMSLRPGTSYAIGTGLVPV